MPTYEYECADCGVMEIFQSIKDDALRRCPECGGRRFRRLISGGGGVIFKGAGFWETDYNRSADYRKQAKEETKAPAGKADEAGKTEAAQDQKPAAKPPKPADEAGSQ